MKSSQTSVAYVKPTIVYILRLKFMCVPSNFLKTLILWHYYCARLSQWSNLFYWGKNSVNNEKESAFPHSLSWYPKGSDFLAWGEVVRRATCGRCTLFLLPDIITQSLPAWNLHVFHSTFRRITNSIASTGRREKK